MKAFLIFLGLLFGYNHMSAELCINKIVNSSLEDKCAVSNKLNSFVVNNKMECYRECTFNIHCLSFFVNEDTGQCTLYGRPVDDLTLVPKDGWMAFEFADDGKRYAKQV